MIPSPEAIRFARRLRKRMPRAEVVLWQALRGNRLEGLSFRRQHPVGPYVLDFYCPAARLAVEVDGPGHLAEQQMDADAARDRYLLKVGIRTLRVTGAEVLHDLARVLMLISRACEQ